jgi:hypothetical protein
MNVRDAVQALDHLGSTIYLLADLDNGTTRSVLIETRRGRASVTLQEWPAGSMFPRTTTKRPATLDAAATLAAAWVLS